MATRYIESVADATALAATLATLPTKAGIVYQEDIAALVVKNPDGTSLTIPTLADTSAIKIAAGQHTTAAASDTVATGLATVVAAVAVLDSDPGDDPMLVSCSIGDQAGTPAAGSILIKTWKNTGGTDPTPAAASTFSKKVNWIAIGT